MSTPIQTAPATQPHRVDITISKHQRLLDIDALALLTGAATYSLSKGVEIDCLDPSHHLLDNLDVAQEQLVEAVADALPFVGEYEYTIGYENDFSLQDGQCGVKVELDGKEVAVELAGDHEMTLTFGGRAQTISLADIGYELVEYLGEDDE